MFSFIHREGNQFVSYTIVLLFSGLVLLLFSPGYITGTVFIALILLLVFIIYFFRNPARPMEKPDDRTVLCPADGEVVVIEKVIENEYFKDARWQISIFMSPLNVHVNRVPISGQVLYYRYHPGKYLVAWHPKSSTENERNTLVLKTRHEHEILVRQIAGAMARRIVCYKTQESESVKQGEDLGFIKFGSRVDVFLPLQSEIRVKKGQKVKGNVDVLAALG